ncbi:MAG: hypothetical protein WCH34_11395 [Bacteroidota bacterium]
MDYLETQAKPEKIYSTEVEPQPNGDNWQLSGVKTRLEKLA